jgi:hypothetical protein
MSEDIYKIVADDIRATDRRSVLGRSAALGLGYGMSPTKAAGIMYSQGVREARVDQILAAMEPPIVRVRDSSAWTGLPPDDWSRTHFLGRVLIYLMDRQPGAIMDRQLKDHHVIFP